MATYFLCNQLVQKLIVNVFQTSYSGKKEELRTLRWLMDDEMCSLLPIRKLGKSMIPVLSRKTDWWCRSVSLEVQFSLQSRRLTRILLWWDFMKRILIKCTFICLSCTQMLHATFRRPLILIKLSNEEDTKVSLIFHVTQQRVLKKTGFLSEKISSVRKREVQEIMLAWCVLYNQQKEQATGVWESYLLRRFPNEISQAEKNSFPVRLDVTGGGGGGGRR